jgi:hypothetical protein
MDENNNSRDSRKNIPITSQSTNNAKLGIAKQFEKLEQILAETNRLTNNQQTIYENVNQEAKKTFDIPLLNITQDDLQNPLKSHNLYYKQYQYYCKKCFPGKAGKKIRDLIKLFLNEGEPKGRDSRMARIPILIEAIDTISWWINKYGGNQVTELYCKFEEMNNRFKK